MDLDEKVTITKSKSSKLENELGDLKSDLEATQSKRDTQKTAYEDQIKSLNEQIVELKVNLLKWTTDWMQSMIMGQPFAINASCSCS